ncbi:MAG: hypothetical protein ACJ8DO_01155 [Microvirga sp.]
MRKFESLDGAVVTAMQRMVETTNDSLESIAQRLDVSVSTVSRYKTQLGWVRPGGELIRPALARSLRESAAEASAAGAMSAAGVASAAGAGPGRGEVSPQPPAAAEPEAATVSAVERRRAVLTRLWAVIEHQTMRIEAGAAGRAQAALSRDVSVLVKTAETLAKVVQNWPPEPPPGLPPRTSQEILADFTARLVTYCEGRELAADEAEDEPDCREARPLS